MIEINCINQFNKYVGVKFIIIYINIIYYLNIIGLLVTTKNTLAKQVLAISVINWIFLFILLMFKNLSKTIYKNEITLGLCNLVMFYYWIIISFYNLKKIYNTSICGVLNILNLIFFVVITLFFSIFTTCYMFSSDNENGNVQHTTINDNIKLCINDDYKGFTVFVTNDNKKDLIDFLNLPNKGIDNLKKYDGFKSVELMYDTDDPKLLFMYHIWDCKQNYEKYHQVISKEYNTYLNSNGNKILKNNPKQIQLLTY